MKTLLLSAIIAIALLFVILITNKTKLINKNKYKFAIKFFNKFLLTKPKYIKYLVKYAECLEYIHQYKKSMKIYEIILKFIKKNYLSWESSCYYLKLAKLYYKLGNIKEAIKNSTKAVDSTITILDRPPHPITECGSTANQRHLAYEFRAKLYFETGEYKNALDDINEAIRELPDKNNLDFKDKIKRADFYSCYSKKSHKKLY